MTHERADHDLAALGRCHGGERIDCIGRPAYTHDASDVAGGEWVDPERVRVRA